MVIQRIATPMRHPVSGVPLLLLVAALGFVVTSAIVGVPVPRIYDEFAYLLSADTFVQGRLTNPTHPFWPHFETFEVIHKPTYQAKYPPAQGLFIAVGVLLGNPIVGVWLGTLLMIGAAFWALHGVARSSWAFFAISLLVLQLGIAHYWTQSYWGGCVAAAGGAFVFGAAARITRARPTAWDGCLGGFGLALLANSRPLEGFVLAVVIGVWVLLGVRRRGVTRRHLVSLAAVALVACGGLTWTAIYNRAVTGHPLVFPYMVHERTYAPAPFIWFMPAPERQVSYTHELMEEQHWRGLDRHERLQREGILGVFRRAPRLIWSVAGGGFVALLLIPVARDKFGVLPASAAFLAVAIAVLMTPAGHPHYLAPAIAPLYALLALVGERISEVRPAVVKAFVSLVLFLTLISLYLQLRTLLLRGDDWAVQRAVLIEQLREVPRQDLVFVHYPPNYERRADLVYNRADIDGADVVWARPIDPKSDSALANYFSNHVVWDLQVGDRLVLRLHPTVSVPDSVP